MKSYEGDNISQDYWDTLIKEIVEGNVNRFKEIIDTFQSRLESNVAFYVRGNQEMIDEVLQQTFLEIFKSLEKFSFGKPIYPWMKQIAKNTACNYIRSYVKDVKLKQEFRVETQIIEHAQDQEQKEGQIKQLRDCLESLEENSRKIMKLFYYEKKKVDEIAEIMEKNHGALRVAMLRIRKVLKDCMQAHREKSHGY